MQHAGEWGKTCMISCLFVKGLVYKGPYLLPGNVIDLKTHVSLSNQADGELGHRMQNGNI